MQVPSFCWVALPYDSLLLRRFVFSHGRGERETRVTGDEPQGIMGRVQAAGEAPVRSYVVFLAKKVVFLARHNFWSFKSWKRSILVDR